MKTRTLGIALVPFVALVTVGCGGDSGSKPPAASTPTARPAAASPAPASTPPAPAATTGTAGATGAVATAPISAAAAAEAETLFTQRCVTCHGSSGKGDGPAAGALNPKPRDYSSPEWHATVTDEQIAQIIVQGGPAFGKSVLMPPNPDLAGKPDVVAALVAKIRGFRPN